MKDNLQIYDAVLKNEDDGILFISLVDEPAMQIDFLKFKNDNKSIDVNDFKYDIFKLSAIDKSKKILIGSFIQANTPIYRKQETLNGDIFEYYINFNKNVIEQIVERFSKNNLNNNIDCLHNNEVISGGAFVKEHWIVESEKDKIYNYFETNQIPLYSWVGIVKIEDDNFWKDEILTENIKGFSIQIKNELVKSDFNNNKFSEQQIEENYEKMLDILLENNSVDEVYNKLLNLFK